MKTRASARVTLTVEVSVGSAWGPGTTIDQVYDQATTEAIGAIRNMVEKCEKTRSIKIIGEPKVTAVLAEREN